MDHLLAARSRRMRGRIRFQKNLDIEIQKVRKTRERLEEAIGACIEELQVAKMARRTGMYTEYHASAKIADIAWVKAAGRGEAEAEVLAGVIKQLTKRFIKLFATRRDHYSLTGEYK